MGFIDPSTSECGNIKCIPCYGERGHYVGSPTHRKIKAKEKEALDKKAAATPTGTDSTLPHITAYPFLVDAIPDLAAESLRLAAEIKPKEEQRKLISADIKALLDAADCGSVRGDGWAIIHFPESSTWTVSEEKLLAAGVDMETIVACRVESKKASYVQVARRDGNGKL